jgi:serine/threonine protein kinase
MANVTSVRDYCTLLRKSKLLSTEDIETFYRQWRDETRGTDDQVDRFRKFLIAQRVVTEWQAALIQRGRAEGFFLGGYKILDRIGKGQMGGVYKAVHTLGQLVAVKILPSSKAKDQHLLGRFQREARLLLQLDHPNVVRAFQLGETNGVHYIVMEYLEGETLDETLACRKQLPWAEAVRLVHQALGGLQHLHERRMVHRDLKPANLMLVPAPSNPDTTWEATVKILDIGLGRELFTEDLPPGQVETQLTVEGTVLGTPDYLAPEQAKDARSADIRADIYSLGCVFYHCLAGRLPFPETNLMTQMLKHATEKPPPLTNFAPDLPPALVSVIDRMMAKFPEQRYPTPAAAAEALKPFLGTGGAAPAPAAVVPAFQKWLETESHLEAPGLPPEQRHVGAAPPPVAVTVPVSGSVKPAAVGSRPVSVAPPRSPTVPSQWVADEVDVELVSESLLASTAPPAVSDDRRQDQRALWDVDRRDWIMLAAGAAGVLAAVGVGYALARVARKKPPEGPPPEPGQS